MLRFMLASALIAATLQAGPPKRPTVHQADHLQVESSDPRNLFDFFTDTLQLPVAWTYTVTAGSAGGGFGTGNFSVRIFRPADRKTNPGRARYVSVALEPYSLRDCALELDARGIEHKAPEPYVSILPNGKQGTLWTTVLLTGLSRPEFGIFLYEYSPAFLNVYVRRNQLAGELTLRKGGPLGIVSVREIVLATTDLKRDSAEWQRLLAPLKPVAPNTWRPGNGPAIRLIPSHSNRIESMGMGVRSLEECRAFLQKRKILGSSRPDEIRISPSQTQGLIVRLREE